MISIFVMYSTDRERALQYTLSCLQDMPGYLEAQKTLIVDRNISGYRPSDWGTIEVPRFDGKFSWGHMWDAGVCSARHDIVLYLDSDRLLPREFLEIIIKNIKEDTFLFTSQHFMILGDMPLETCKRFLMRSCNDGVLSEDEYFGKLKYEPRWISPMHGPGKNVMSGCTAFLKRTYFKVGSVDPWYCGHGAFADTDYHYRAKKAGCKFLDLCVPELHCHHHKEENGQKVDEMTLRRKGLDNFIYYIWKWKLPKILADHLAYRLAVYNPSKYVEKKMEELSKTVD
jgi:hypothetical protein